MSQIVLVFDGDEDGDPPTEVPCVRVTLRACDLAVNDFIACPFTGFVHTHELNTKGKLIYVKDCNDHEHIYNANDLLEVARPE